MMMKRNAFDLLMHQAKKAKHDHECNGIPAHLQKLVNKCPQWRTSILNLCGGECGHVFQAMTYKEMEKEISNRNNFQVIRQSIANKAVDLGETIKKRLQNVVNGKSFPKVEQKRFSEASIGKGKLLKQRINSFLYGGHIYMEHIKGSKQFNGLLDFKVKSTERGDVVFFRELQVVCDEVNALMAFLCSDHDKILSFINCRGDITRQYNLDRQAKGTEGLRTRKLANMKKAKSLKSLGEAPRVFVPLANVLIAVESEVKCEQKDSKAVLVTVSDSDCDSFGEGDIDKKRETLVVSSDDESLKELSPDMGKESDRTKDEQLSDWDEPWGKSDRTNDEQLSDLDEPWAKSDRTKHEQLSDWDEPWGKSDRTKDEQLSDWDEPWGKSASDSETETLKVEEVNEKRGSDDNAVEADPKHETQVSEAEADALLNEILAEI